MNEKRGIIGGVKMKDASVDDMSADGGKGNIRDKLGEHSSTGCRSNVEF